MLSDPSVCYLEVSDTTQVTAALEAATMRRSSGTSGLPCSKQNQHITTMLKCTCVWSPAVDLSCSENVAYNYK